MKYYEMHDDVYKGLRKKGVVTWDGQKDVNLIYEHHINLAINERLSDFFPDYTNKKVLDLGTGTGTCALYLAKKGFSSTGYDVSFEAIEIAKENALNLKVESEFKVQDICEYHGDTKYDLVVDSSFLHCIVPQNERDNIYSSVRSVLNKDGYFFVHTMIQSDDMSDMLSKEHIFLKDETLWSTGKDSWDMDWQNIDGKRVFPHRKILSIKNLESEISNNGFEVVDKTIQMNDKSTSTYIAWLKVVD